MLSEEEKKAIECIKQELIEPFYNFPNPTSIELKDIKVEFLERVINLVDKQQKEIEDYKKFKKDIVSKIMIWDKEGLPKDEVVIRMIDTLMEEVSRLEDIEDKKVQVEISFIEEKRDKYWKDKIREKMEEIMGYAFTTSEERHCQNYAYDRLKELLEENDE